MIASHLDRLDVWHRNVPWSQAKQLRTVVETELSVDSLFDSLHFSFGGNGFARVVEKYGLSKKIKKITAGAKVQPFIFKERNSVVGLLYRQIPLPWYVTMQCFGY